MSVESIEFITTPWTKLLAEVAVDVDDALCQIAYMGKSSDSDHIRQIQQKLREKHGAVVEAAKSLRTLYEDEIDSKGILIYSPEELIVEAYDALMGLNYPRRKTPEEIQQEAEDAIQETFALMEQFPGPSTLEEHREILIILSKIAKRQDTKDKLSGEH